MSRSISRRRFVGGSSAAIGALLFGTRLNAQTLPGRVKVGVLVALSGAAGAFGRSGVNAWQQAVENLNAAGGLWGGGKGLVDLEVLDDKTTPASAVEAVGRLASDKAIPVIVSLVAVPSTLQASVEAERSQLPFVNTGSVEPTLNTRGLAYVFSTCPTIRTFVASQLQGTRKVFEQAKIRP